MGGTEGCGRGKEEEKWWMSKYGEEVGKRNEE